MLSSLVQKTQLTLKKYDDIINTNMIPNPVGFVIDVFIDIGVKQSR